MYSATLLVSLLASSHGFASTPDDPIKPIYPPVEPVECYDQAGRLGEKFFVYSMDLTQILVFAAAGMKVTLPESVTHGLIGKTWEGVELSITQHLEGGDQIQFLQDDNGGPLTMPSPNIAVPQRWSFVSGDFCLPNGNWTVKVNSPKYNYGVAPAAGGAGGWGWDLISYKPLLDYVNNTFGQDLVALGIRPFSLYWSIFPAGKREEAEAVPKTGPAGYFSLSYIEDNWVNTPKGTTENNWATCQVNFTQNYWVPAPDHSCWEFYGFRNASNYPLSWQLPENGPCPRPESGSGDDRRRLSSDEAEPQNVCIR